MCTRASASIATYTRAARAVNDGAGRRRASRNIEPVVGAEGGRVAVAPRRNAVVLDLPLVKRIISVHCAASERVVDVNFRVAGWPVARFQRRP